MPPILFKLVSSPMMGKPQYGVRPILSGTVPPVTVPRVNFTISVTFAVDTHTAGTFGRIKTKAVSFATDTHTAGTFGRRKTRVLTSAIDTHTAGSLGRVKTKALGFATDTHTAGVLGSVGGAGSGAPKANWLRRYRKKNLYS